jgi:DnaK suppressor protein
MDLSKNDLQQLKSIMLKQKQELLQADETGQQAEETVELDQSRMGRLSRLDAMQSQAMSKETGRRRRRHLVEIDAALKRIDDGEYGLCSECGEFISMGRLAANPAVRLCIACAQALESRQ